MQLVLKILFIIHFPVIMISSVFGVSLFYIQHQYEDVIWRRKDNWDYKTVALEGSSFFKLPPILQWFTGNIGFHHIHHLGPSYSKLQIGKMCGRKPHVSNRTYYYSLIIPYAESKAVGRRKRKGCRV
jgi:omega-6 fatty acid desaturase (delta-12 desaturase)